VLLFIVSIKLSKKLKIFLSTLTLFSYLLGFTLFNISVFCQLQILEDEDHIHSSKHQSSDSYCICSQDNYNSIEQKSDDFYNIVDNITTIQVENEHVYVSIDKSHSQLDIYLPNDPHRGPPQF
jgi:hypothetical protein